MSDSKIAKRYARALADLCAESQDHAAVAKEMKGFATLYSESAELQGALGNPTLNLEQKRGVLSALLKKANATTKTNNFLLVLLERGRIDSVPEVASAFQSIIDLTEKRLRATVTSSVAMSEADLDRVRSALSRLTGQTVSLDAQVDAELIGGARVQIGNVVLESSIRSHLDNLRDQLIN